MDPEFDSLINEYVAAVREMISRAAQRIVEFEAKAEVDDCDAIAREGFAMLDEEEAKSER
jgi:hypothetical protein